MCCKGWKVGLRQEVPPQLQGKKVLALESCRDLSAGNSDTGPQRQWNWTSSSQQVERLKIGQMISLLYLVHAIQNQLKRDEREKRQGKRRSKKIVNAISRWPESPLEKWQILWNQMTHWRNVSLLVKRKKKKWNTKWNSYCWLWIQRRKMT